MLLSDIKSVPSISRAIRLTFLFSINTSISISLGVCICTCLFRGFTLFVLHFFIVTQDICAVLRLKHTEQKASKKCQKVPSPGSSMACTRGFPCLRAAALQWVFLPGHCFPPAASPGSALLHTRGFLCTGIASQHAPAYVQKMFFYQLFRAFLPNSFTTCFL